MALRGGGEIEIEGERIPLDEDHMARVGPGAKRKVLAGREGIRMLILGGKPRRGSTRRRRSELGEPTRWPGRA